jgi:hypothetical protein
MRVSLTKPAQTRKKKQTYAQTKKNLQESRCHAYNGDNIPHRRREH